MVQAFSNQSILTMNPTTEIEEPSTWNSALTMEIWMIITQERMKHLSTKMKSTKVTQRKMYLNTRAKNHSGLIIIPFAKMTNTHLHRHPLIMTMITIPSNKTNLDIHTDRNRVSVFFNDLYSNNIIKNEDYVLKR